jgi:hypothetical protein
MGVMFVVQQRSSQKQSLRDVSTDRALLHIARKRGTHSPEELARMEAEVRRGEFVILSGWFNDIRHRNLQAFRLIGDLLRDRESKAGKLRQKLTIETEKELRCWSRTVEVIQAGHPEVFHPAHLLRPDLDPEFRALQLGYLYLAVLGQQAHHQTQGLLDHEGKPTTLLHERLYKAVHESALTPYLDTTRGVMAYPLAELPEDEPWRTGALRSLYLDYLSDSLVLAATQGGLNLDSSRHLSPFAEAERSDYIPRTLKELGERLDRHIETTKRSDESPTKGAAR